jgi:hypothetical protein
MSRLERALESLQGRWAGAARGTPSMASGVLMKRTLKMPHDVRGDVPQSE